MDLPSPSLPQEQISASNLESKSNIVTTARWNKTPKTTKTTLNIPITIIPNIVTNIQSLPQEQISASMSNIVVTIVPTGRLVAQKTPKPLVPS